MRGWTLHGIVAIAAGGCAAALAAQVVPGPGDTGPDIVVNGAPPQMVAGLWRFHAGKRYADPMPGVKAPPPGPDMTWDRCVGDGDTAAILDQLVGERAQFETSGASGSLCSPLTLTIRQAHIAGSRRCTMMGGAPFAIHATTRLRATIAETRMDARYVREVSTIQGRGQIMRWQMTAERVGDCAAPTPAAAPAAPAITAPPAPQLAIVQDSAAQPADRAAVPAPPADTATRPNDIVVIARKLRRLRLHYASSGKAMRWCHADITSGDPRLDRIGCALVRACVKEGFDEPVTALACVNRKVDSLVPVGGVLADE
ncbi:MAG: hypothetical protein PGN08_02060 [Sphingomonas taxi]